MSDRFKRVGLILIKRKMAGKKKETKKKDEPKCGYEKCPRLAEKESKFCIFHISAEEKERRGLWKKCMEQFYELVDNGEGDFRGFILKDINLIGRVFEQEIDFSGSIFVGLSKFSDILEGKKTLFKNIVSFENTEFINDADFSGTIFYNYAFFRGVMFDRDAIFIETTFRGNADFIKMRCSSDANYDDVMFNDKVSFQESKIYKLYLSRATFREKVDFSGGMFGDDTVFSDTNFSKNANFREIRIKKGIFVNANFNDRVIFSPKEEDKKDGIPTFTNADFKAAYFEKGGSFDDCIIKEGHFENSSIQNVSFRNVNLDNVCFAGAQMELTYLADSKWTAPPNRSKMEQLKDMISVSDPRYVLKEELEAKKISKENREEKIKALQNAEGTYRRIKHSLQNEGEYEKASGFYIHEMKMKRKRYWYTLGLIAKWNFFWNWFYAISCGYSERPKRVVINALILILIFTTVYYSCDAIGKGGDEEYNPSLRESFYFSVVTFTTLGYGDYSPKLNFQLVAVSEAFIGAFTMALFVLVFGRKVMR